MGKNISEIINKGFIELSIKYAQTYSKNPKTFINTFISCNSIKMACAFIVKAYKQEKIFEECQKSGKNFCEYANRKPIEDKWKIVLAEILLILYSIIHP